jgi:hypothetical protein
MDYTWYLDFWFLSYMKTVDICGVQCDILVNMHIVKWSNLCPQARIMLLKANVFHILFEVILFDNFIYLYYFHDEH